MSNYELHRPFDKIIYSQIKKYLNLKPKTRKLRHLQEFSEGYSDKGNEPIPETSKQQLHTKGKKKSQT